MLPPGSVNGLAVDVSNDACRLAAENAFATGFDAIAHENSLHRLKGRSVVQVVQADMLDPEFPDFIHCGGSRFDIITCNPPYISLQEYVSLPKSVKDFEDPLALVGDISNTKMADPETLDGLEYFRTLRKLVPKLLKPAGGIFAAEFGASQSSRVRTILGHAGLFKSFEIWNDAFGRTRVAIGKT